MKMIHIQHEKNYRSREVSSKTTDHPKHLSNNHTLAPSRVGGLATNFNVPTVKGLIPRGVDSDLDRPLDLHLKKGDLRIGLTCDQGGSPSET